MFVEIMVYLALLQPLGIPCNPAVNATNPTQTSHGCGYGELPEGYYYLHERRSLREQPRARRSRS